MWCNMGNALKKKYIMQASVEPIEKNREHKDKIIQKSLSKVFYSVNNHQALFKVGQSFYDDFKSGIKSFAITSDGCQVSQQRSILGIASFLDQKETLKIAVVSDNMTHGAFRELVLASEHETIHADDTEIDVHSFYGTFDFIDLKKLLYCKNSTSEAEFDQMLNVIYDHYDVIFWDVPKFEIIEEGRNEYFPIMNKFESLSFVAVKGESVNSRIEEITEFYKGYGIKIKGVLIEEGSENKVETKKKSIWKRIFG